VQAPLVHWVASAHVAPFFAVQAPAAQKKYCEQSDSTKHEVLQLTASWQVNPGAPCGAPHVVGVLTLSTKQPAAPAAVPLHFLLRRSDVEARWPAMMLGSSVQTVPPPQAVPLGLAWQSPEPLQPPYMQLDESAGQAASEVPAATALQVPAPFRLHAWHFPHDEEVQHTPFVQ